MKHISVLPQALRFCTAILLGILLLPLAPAHSSAVAASIPGEAFSPQQQPLDAGPAAGTAAWTRTLDPVIVSGSLFPLFHGVSLGDLFVYAYKGGTWSVVPFQFDEIMSGTFVAVEDALLDWNDELVFMASDLGEQVAPSNWLDDADSRNYSRYEVQVTNPLNIAEQGWVYVYRSSTLAPTFSPYVTWESATNLTRASTYLLVYAPTSHLGIDGLYLNGSANDVIDRSKFRLAGACYADEVWESFSITEDSEELKDSYEPPDIKGPVRVGGGNLDQQSWAYASMFEDRAEFDPNDDVDQQCDEMRFEIFRISLDWRNPSTSAMAPMTYYDSNRLGGVSVDGAFDSVAVTPLALWRQFSGALGTVVQVADVTGGGFLVTNYYRDDAGSDPQDTGDKQSFGDAGFQMVNPTHTAQMLMANYVLPANLGAVGATYRDYYSNPVQTAATTQDYDDCTPDGVAFSWQPIPVYRDVETTFTATVGSGTEPFTYTWTWGDGGSAVVANPASYAFGLSGMIPVTLTVSNECGAARPLVRQVVVWEPGTQPYWTYVPLVLSPAP